MKSNYLKYEPEVKSEQKENEKLNAAPQKTD